MKRWLSVATIASLLMTQPASVVDVLAQTFSASAASEGVGAVRAAGAPTAIPSAASFSSPLALGVSLRTGAASLSAPAPAAAAGSLAAPAASVSAAASAAEGFVPAAAAVSAPASDAVLPAASAPADSRSEAAAAVAAPTGLRAVIANARARLFPAKAAAAPETTIASTFDGSAAKPAIDSPVPAANAALPSGRIRAYLVHPGRKPVMTTLEELPALAAQSGFAADFNANGHLRVVLGEGKLEGPTLAESDVAGLKAALAAGGLNVADKRARTDSIPIKTALAASPAAANAAAPDAGKRRAGWAQISVRVAVGLGVAALYVAHFGTMNPLAPVLLAFLVANVDRAVRESAYALGMLKAAFKESKRPRWNEILGGVIGKIVPAIVNLGIFAAMYHGHPVALAMAAALSLAVETFHGVWVNAWDTFQSKIGRHRGMLYQNIFNFIYGQMISGSFRTITYFTLGNVPPPWSIEYWKAVSAMTLIGTFCGTLGYRGLNSIYEKGRIPRWGRAGIQQMRDFCMMMIGPFFGTGNMFMTWLLFGIMQTVDLAIFAVDRMLDTRPIIYLADERVASSDTFKAIYIDRPSPLTEAVNGVKNSIIAKPFVAAYRWARGRRAPKPAAPRP